MYVFWCSYSNTFFFLALYQLPKIIVCFRLITIWTTTLFQFSEVFNFFFFFWEKEYTFFTISKYLPISYLFYLQCGMYFFLITDILFGPHWILVLIWKDISRPAVLAVLWDFCSLNPGLGLCFLNSSSFSFFFPCLLLFSQVHQVTS